MDPSTDVVVSLCRQADRSPALQPESNRQCLERTVLLNAVQRLPERARDAPRAVARVLPNATR